MGPMAAVLTLVAIVAAGMWFQYRLSQGRAWSPLWLAFSNTFAAGLLLVSGSIGFRLQTTSLATSRWSDSVIWPEVGVGLVFAGLAVLFWRRAIRDTDRKLHQI